MVTSYPEVLMCKHVGPSVALAIFHALPSCGLQTQYKLEICIEVLGQKQNCNVELCKPFTCTILPSQGIK